MIDPKELMIGNWVEKPNGEQIEIEADDIMTISMLFEDLRPRPIPLTEEWLLKFGFESHDKECSGIYTKKIEVEPSYISGSTIRTLSASPDCEKYFLDGNYLLRIDYVHQLQNLVKSLTQKELKITE